MLTITSSFVRFVCQVSNVLTDIRLDAWLLLGGSPSLMSYRNERKARSHHR